MSDTTVEVGGVNVRKRVVSGESKSPAHASASASPDHEPNSEDADASSKRQRSGTSSPNSANDPADSAPNADSGDAGDETHADEVADEPKAVTQAAKELTTYQKFEYVINHFKGKQREKVIYFREININDMFVLTEAAKKIALRFSDDSMSFSKIMTPIGVLEFPAMTYFGNWFDKTQYGPAGKLENVKQGVNWSPRAYDNNLVAPDLLHDIECSEYIKFSAEFDEWFLTQFQDAVKRKLPCIAPIIKNLKGALQQGGVANPNIDDMIRLLRQGRLIRTLNRRTAEEPYHGAFRTGLFRQLTAKEKADRTFRYNLRADLPKRAPTSPEEATYFAEAKRFLETAWNHPDKYRIKHVRMLTLKSTEELRRDGWPACDVVKEINREDIHIQNGDLGAVIYSPAVGIVTDNSKVGVKGYIDSIFWFSTPTERSKQYDLRVNVSESGTALPLPMFGSSENYDVSRIAATRPEITDESESAAAAAASSSSSSGVLRIEASEEEAAAAAAAYADDFLN